MGFVFLGFLLLVGSFVMRGLNKQTSSKVNLQPAAWASGIVGLLFMIIGSLWGAFVQVPAGYSGVLLRFGALQGTLTPGIHMVVPGVQSVVLMETRTQKEESTASAASRDLQVVTTVLALNFRIDQAKVDDLYGSVGTMYKARIIDPTVQESLKVVTSRYTAEELIRNRQQVKSEVEADITRRLSQYNIIVDPSGLSIVNFDFSPEFNKAIEAKSVAQQEAERQKFVLQQAELQRQTEVARAKGQSEAAKLNAESLRISGGSLVIAREWIEKWDGKLPSVSAGGGGASGGGFIIDLKSLMETPQQQNNP